MSQTKAQSERWQAQLAEDRKALLAQPAFCRFTHDLLATMGLFGLSYAGENTHATAFREGGRNIGLNLLADLEAVQPNVLAHLAPYRAPQTTAKEPPHE